MRVRPLRHCANDVIPWLLKYMKPEHESLSSNAAYCLNHTTLYPGFLYQQITAVPIIDKYSLMSLLKTLTLETLMLLEKFGYLFVKVASKTTETASITYACFQLVEKTSWVMWKKIISWYNDKIMVYWYTEQSKGTLVWKCCVQVK